MESLAGFGYDVLPLAGYERQVKGWIRDIILLEKLFKPPREPTNPTVVGILN